MRWTPNRCQQLVDLMSKGYFPCQIYKAMSITEKTFYTWLKDYPEFQEAFELGLPLQEASWVERGITEMEKNNEKGFKYWDRLVSVHFKNRGYAKTETAANVTNIQNNINTVNVINEKTDAELLEFVKEKMQDLNLIEYQHAEKEDSIPNSRIEN